MEAVELEQVRCPLCEEDDAEELFKGKDRMHHKEGLFHVVRCRRCGLIYVNPRPSMRTIGHHYPDDYYAYQKVKALEAGKESLAKKLKHSVRDISLRVHFGYGAPVSGAALLAIALWPLKFKVRRRFGPGELLPYVRGGVLLDVGCGSGQWLQMMKRLGWDVHGVELSEKACEVARSAGLRVFNETLEEAEFPEGHFDVVRLWHVLEHLPDPLGTLREIRRILKPNGTVVIGVPNAGGIAARWFGTYWSELDVPRHLVSFSKRTLAQMVSRSGLRVERIKTVRYGASALLRSYQYVLDERNRGGVKLTDRGWLVMLGNWASCIASFVGFGDHVEVWTRSPQVTQEG